MKSVYNLYILNGEEKLMYCENVLCVDTDKESRDELSGKLSSYAQTIYCAKNNSEAINIFNERQIDIAFISLSNPDDEGFLLFEKMQRMDCHLMAVINGDDTRTLKRVVGLNFVSLMFRPINDELLSSKIKGISQILNLMRNKRERDEELEKLATALEQITTMIIVTDAQGNIEYINPAFETFTGYSLDEAKEDPANILKNQMPGDTVNEKLWEKLKNGETWSGDLRNKRKDGTVYWHKTSVSPVLDDKGALKNVVAVLDDVSDKKAGEQYFKNTQMYLGIVSDLSQMMSYGKPLQTMLEFVVNRINEINPELLSVSVIMKEHDPTDDEDYIKIMYSSGIKNIADIVKSIGNLDLLSVKVRFEDSPGYKRLYEKGVIQEFEKKEELENYFSYMLPPEKQHLKKHMSVFLEKTGIAYQCFVPLKVKDKVIGHIGLSGESHIHYHTLDFIKLVVDKIAAVLEYKRTQQALSESEEQYRTLIQQMQDGTFLIVKGKFQFVNPAFASMLGYEESDMINMPIMNIVADREKDKVLDIYQNRLEGKNPASSYETILKKKDESELYVNISSRLITYKGAPATMGTVKDISSRKNAEEALRKNSNLLKNIFQSIQNSLCVINKDFEIIHVNKQTEKLFAQKVPLIGKKCHDVYRGYNIKCINCPAEKTFKTGKASNLEVDMIIHGQKRWYEVSTLPMFDQFGNVENVLEFYEDITQSKLHQSNVESELSTKRKSIERAIEMQKSLNKNELPIMKEVGVQAAYLPSEDLSGDLFDIRCSSDNKLLMLLADCTGHGVEASMDATLMKAVSDRHFWLLNDVDSPSDFIKQVNIDLMHYTAEGKYPAIFACVIDLNKKLLYYANAGIPLPIIKRADGKLETLSKVKGFLLGFDRNSEYEQNSVYFGDGDELLVYSDAVLETKGVKTDDLFMKDRLDTHFQSSRPENTVALLIQALGDFHGGLPLEDDLTLISVLLKKEVAFDEDIKNQEELSNLLERVDSILRGFRYGESESAIIRLTLHELGTNSIEHGNMNDISKSVKMSFVINCEKVCATITDEGEGFNPDDINDPSDFDLLVESLEANDEKRFTRGRGVWMSAKYADLIRYNDKGNSVYFERNKTFPKTIFSI